MVSFGNLKRLNLRDIWSHEATEFTPWLAEHIADLGEALGLELELEQKEASVGDFSLDLLAKDLGTKRTVVIENQVTGTDHDHLGKLLTYASGFDASIVIWIAETIREEHRQALEWLNERTNDDTEFFGVVIEVLKVDESKPAYNFRPIVFPNEWKKSVNRSSSAEVSEKMERYRTYFQQLIDELRDVHKFTNAKTAQPQNWRYFCSGVPGFGYGMSFAQGNKVRTELYIDTGDNEKNKAVYDIIFKDKETIERDYGQSLSWERLDKRRGCRIALYRDGSIDMDIEALNEIKEWSITNLFQMRETFKDRLQRYLEQADKQCSDITN